MRFTAHDASGVLLERKIFYSVGGGFVVAESEIPKLSELVEGTPVPYPFASAAELLAHGSVSKKRIPEMVRVNELTLRSPAELRSGLLERWAVMNDCIERGMRHDGMLPGGLNVRRRAKGLRDSLVARRERGERSPSEAIDWASVYAIAVNEENAAGGRVVTAPTNGAAGIIPAVIRYYREFYPESNEDGIVAFLLTAAAIGGLCKRNASLSGAEVGCQGEVGVACSMAAGGLAAALGGSNAQIENAAEIGIEHHLGMSCDPGGRPGADSVHRAQRHGRGESDQCRLARPARRRLAPGCAGHGHQDDVRHRSRHDGQVQRDLARRPGRQRGRLLARRRRRSQRRRAPLIDLQTVAHAGLGAQEARIGRVGLQLVPQLRHVDAQVVPVLDVRRPPHLGEQLPVRAHLSGVANQHATSRRYSLGVRCTSCPARCTRRAARSTWTSPKSKLLSASTPASRAARRSAARIRASSSPMPNGLVR